KTFSQKINEAIGQDSPETVDARDELGARIQRELLTYLLKARTPSQLYQKPRAYPGDFRALEMIAEAKPDGTSPVGTLLDEAFLQLPSCVALREGRELLISEYSEHFPPGTTTPVYIAGVG